MSVIAIAKGVQISPRKVMPVASLVRGRTVSDALIILEHTPRLAAKQVAKVIASARANAEHNHGYKPSTLVVSEICVNPASRLKRYMPVARGSANPFQHKNCHIRVVVDGEKRAEKPKDSEKTTTKGGKK